METEVQHKTKEPTYPFRAALEFISTEVKVVAMIEAQHRALVAIMGMERTAARVELYWLVYNNEFRQFIERWVRKSA